METNWNNHNSPNSSRSSFYLHHDSDNDQDGGGGGDVVDWSRRAAEDGLSWMDQDNEHDLKERKGAWLLHQHDQGKEFEEKREWLLHPRQQDEEELEGGGKEAWLLHGRDRREEELEEKEAWLLHHRHHHQHEEGEELEEDRAGPSGDGVGDVYMQLAQKDQDLMLAAELGKALLEKNQELELQVSKLTEEYNQRVEELQQERHSLQTQLAQREAEYENTARDLQEDIVHLKEQVRHHGDETSAGQRKHMHDLRQLQQHNEALGEQLRQSLAQQQALSLEVGQLREQLTSRRSNLHQRVDHVDQLEDEVECLRLRHQELEVQIRQVREERDALATELENLHERLLLLEKQRQMHEEQLHHQHTELLELRDTNSILQSQLERVTSRCNVSGDSPTLFSELSHLKDPRVSPPSSFLQFSGEKMNCLSSELVEEDNFEYDDDIFSGVITHSTPVPPDMGCQGDYSGSSLHDELFGPQSQLGLPGDGGAQAEGGIQGAACSPSRRPVTLTSELQDLLKEMQYSDSEDDDAVTTTTVLDKGHHSPRHADVEADHDVTEMTYEPSHRDEDEAKEREDDLKNLHYLSQQHFNDMFQAQQSRIESLEKRVEELESRVRELQVERDRLQDAACGDITISSILLQTRGERDKAIARVSEVERELSRLTSDVVTLNGQLMDTIRKKVMISQELDQWQVDLSEVLAVQMHRRMREQQKAEQAIGELQKGTDSDVMLFKKEKKEKKKR